MSEHRPKVRIETSEGDLVIELWPDVAPQHADNFQQLIHDGFYDGLTFHRIIPRFIVQGGCPVGDGTGGPGWNVDAEFNDQPHEKGTLSMARQPMDPHSAGSQFFICLSREYCAHLDGQYTAFGRVVKGLDTLDRLAETPLAHPEIGSPLDPPQIIHAYELWHDEEEEIEDAHAYDEDELHEDEPGHPDEHHDPDRAPEPENDPARAGAAERADAGESAGTAAPGASESPGRTDEASHPQGSDEAAEPGGSSEPEHRPER
jgi:cyclophilin family peptidyl-prolyl cis-trans isomerase